MKTPTKIAIVGAGGIGCPLAQFFSRICHLVLIDGDSYEPRNVTRQFPALKSRGNKAVILRDLLQPHTLFQIEAVPQYFKGEELFSLPEMQDLEMLIAAVDNHDSRKLTAEYCNVLQIPGILAGNENEMGEAHLVAPGVYDPLQHFSFEGGDPPPFACNSDQAMSQGSQTISANWKAVGAVIQLYSSWCASSKPENALAHSALDIHDSRTKRVKELILSPIS